MTPVWATIKKHHLWSRFEAHHQMISPTMAKNRPKVSIDITINPPSWPGGTITNSHHPSRRNPALAHLCSQPSQKLTHRFVWDNQIFSPRLSNSLTLPRGKCLFCRAKSDNYQFCSPFNHHFSSPGAIKDSHHKSPWTIRKSHRNHQKASPNLLQAIDFTAETRSVNNTICLS